MPNFSLPKDNIMDYQIAQTPLDLSAEYFYSVSLLVGAVVNWVLAAMLFFDPDNFLYTETPRYLRSRYLTALSLAVFGIGFFLHWWFMPRFYYPIAASALSLGYFHIGGTLLSMSHTGLIDRHYLTFRVALRDVSVLILSVLVYGMSALLQSHTLLYIGFGLFFLHIGFLTCKFYQSFHRIYLQLGNYANYFVNDTDRDMRWLFFSCHLIILFGIGGIAVTLLFPNDTLPFTLLMFVGVGIFGYIYKALDGFSALAYDSEVNLQKSEEYLHTEQGRKEMKLFRQKRLQIFWLGDFPLFSGFVKQW